LSPLGNRQLWLNLQRETFFASTFTAAFIGFPTFFFEGTVQPNQRNKDNYVKKITLVEREREILSYFVVGANTKPLGANA